VVSLPEEAFTVVPVSTVMHENEQLKFDRSGVPLCCNGANCVAMSYPQLCRPLNKYLYPHEQQHFNDHGVLPDEMAIPGECLLCIRDSIHIVVRFLICSLSARFLLSISAGACWTGVHHGFAAHGGQAYSHYAPIPEFGRPGRVSARLLPLVKRHTRTPQRGRGAFPYLRNSGALASKRLSRWDRISCRSR